MMYIAKPSLSKVSASVRSPLFVACQKLIRISAMDENWPRLASAQVEKTLKTRETHSQIASEYKSAIALR